MFAVLFYILCFFVVVSVSFYAAMIFLASVLPVFNFKDEFVEYWIRTRGSPPTRRQIILNIYGAGSYYFMAEKCWDQHRPNAIRLVPNRNLALNFALAFASWVTVVLFWIAVFVAYSYLRSLF